MSSSPPPSPPPVYAFIDSLPFKYNNRSAFIRIFHAKRGIKSEVKAKINSSKAAKKREGGAGAAVASLLKFDRELGAIKISGINVGRDRPTSLTLPSSFSSFRSCSPNVFFPIPLGNHRARRDFFSLETIVSSLIGKIVGKRRASLDYRSGPGDREGFIGDNDIHGGWGALWSPATITVQRNVHATVTGAIHGY